MTNGSIGADFNPIKNSLRYRFLVSKFKEALFSKTTPVFVLWWAQLNVLWWQLSSRWHQGTSCLRSVHALHELQNSRRNVLWRCISSCLKKVTFYKAIQFLLLIFSGIFSVDTLVNIVKPFVLLHDMNELERDYAKVPTNSMIIQVGCLIHVIKQFNWQSCIALWKWRVLDVLSMIL